MLFSKYIVALSYFLVGANAYAADRCDVWANQAYPVVLKACSYENGGSGYYVIENTGSTAAKVCWSVNFNNGRTDKGCNSNLGAGESSKGSCFSCGSQNSGAHSITLLKYESN